MGNGTLTIYSASAGSGKTYTLTEMYLTSLFRSRYSYRKILAVTFTNKATAEMKSRILDNLHKLATGSSSDYLAVLMKSTGKAEGWIRNEAGEILNAILHDFSRFSVSTIDSFFQKILRAFTREAGLHSGFNVELEHSNILSSAVDEMLGSAVAGTQLNRWLTVYAMTNIEEDKNWNLRDGIIKLSEELFKEKFKILSSGERSNLENKEFLLGYIEKIRSLADSFEKRLTELGREAERFFSEYGLTEDMFYQKGRGIPGFIAALAAGSVKEPNSYVREIEKAPPKWSSGEPVPPLQLAIGSGLEIILLEILHFFDTNLKDYKTANAILSNIYALGILSDVLYNIHLITTTENSFLLSDAGEVLSLITGEDQSPFIYEKVGNRYENFMIDEFQDTSIIQWNNLRPLIDNSMAEGFDNLVVGDVKQSIYRWRNSDWKILGSFLNDLIDNERYISKPLIKNWRSLSNIIKFNNSLFTVIPAQIDELFEGDPDRISFRNIYSEAVQSGQGEREGGFIRIEFIDNEDELKWKERVLEMLPGIVKSLQIKGYNASDIGIIVRDGKDGASVLKTFIDYHSGCSDEEKQNINYNVVSSDSLLLSNSPAIRFIIAVLSSVNDPQDMISRALMLRFYLLAHGNHDAEKASLASDRIDEISANFYPDGYEAFLDRLKQLPLFEATESIIGFFELGKSLSNVAYLNTFQDYVVSFTGSKSGDLQSFLEWWESTGSGKSVVLPGNQNAMRILTIHKSKGLEFKVVILPFLSWNLDHMPSKQPFLWVRPETVPFNDIGVVPVKYSSELLKTWFAENYADEKHSVYVDNINLLYVAMTRAKEVIFAFSEENPKTENSIAGVLKRALMSAGSAAAQSGIEMNRFYDTEKRLFEFGEIPFKQKEIPKETDFESGEYIVSQAMDSLKLKLHGENYFSTGDKEIREKINYGKLMHEIFEGIKTPADIKNSVRKLVLEGKVTEAESEGLEKRVEYLIGSPRVAEWFMPGNEILTEAGILLPSGVTRRPDRVIFKDGKAMIIDFKFGDESSHYVGQVNQYRQFMSDMGYSKIEAYIWYVDKNLIVSA
jgi:ATP-dependent helicase/nuclease subunit A